MAAKVRIDVEANTSGAQSAFSKLGTSFTELKSAIGLVEQGFDAAKQAFDATIGKGIEYDDKVKTLATDLSLTAEESSKLIGVSMQYGVTAEQLTGALDTMAKRGISPNVDLLADLSDKFLATNNAADRAALMSEALGKGWTKLNPILEKGGDAIRAQAAGLNTALIRTQADLDATEALQIKVDQLNASLQAQANILESKTMPAMLDFMTLLNDPSADNAAKLVNEIYKGHILESQAARKLRLEEENLTNATKQSVPVMDEAAASTSHWTATNQDAVTGQAALTAAIEAGRSVTEGYVGMGRSQIEINDQLAGALDRAKAAQENLATAQQNWRDGVAGDVYRALVDAKRPAEEHAKAVEAIDKAYGSNYGDRERMAKDIKDATDNFAKYKDIDSYAVAIGGLEKSFAPFDDKIIAAKTHLEEVNSQLDALNGRHVDAYVDVHINQVDGPSGVDTQLTGTYEGMTGTYITGGQNNTTTGSQDPLAGLRAEGGPVDANKPYLVGEQGPEVFRPDRPGSIIPNKALGGNRFSNCSFTVVTSNPTDFMRQLGGDYNSIRALANVGN